MQLTDLSSVEFLQHVEETLRNFDCQTYPCEHMPRADWQQLVRAGVMHPIIPRVYGGRESHEEMGRVMERVAYYNLSLAMYVVTQSVIIGRNVVVFGSDALQEEVFTDILINGALMGFAVLDPDAASGVSTMKTLYETVEGGYHIYGRKHWQEFSTTADWWLIVAKDKNGGIAGDKMDLFVHRTIDGGWRNTETYIPLGLRLIDFGLNEADVFVPEYRRLSIRHLNFEGILNLIGSSWSQFAAMGAGFLQRVYESAVLYVTQRQTRAGTLYDLGYVRYRLRVIAASRDICRVLFYYMLNKTDIREPLIADLFIQQATKTLCADLMFTGANHYLELCGAEGYRTGAKTNFAATAMSDARAFSILGGANDLLCAMLTQYCLRATKPASDAPFHDVIRQFSHTTHAADLIGDKQELLGKQPTGNLEQVVYGKVLARLFAASLIRTFGREAGLSGEEQTVSISRCKTEIDAELDVLTFSPD
ncbi:MAG TPA: acyl-CoA dehydrogenase family protein [Chitinophaga sp.]|uniref:acyl-CoA dehydrogenase family protein n=1 Tax=Chitinophaga sp. TaxID=1869181 RepID=UPI002C7792BA|nr:acyl-CoA dehydrogenase family protein [Chitinophaga sp.]HVI46078.1 acyl-CoA dehydrogenase family protein [Chitinophaga sp.]